MPAITNDRAGTLSHIRTVVADSKNLAALREKTVVLLHIGTTAAVSTAAGELSKVETAPLSHLQMLRAFAQSHGAVWVRFTWHGGYRVLNGFDKHGFPFSLVIDGNPHEWKRAVAMLSPDGGIEAFDSGLRRHIRLTRSKTNWRSENTYAVKFGDNLGELPGGEIKARRSNTQANASEARNACVSDYEKILPVPQYGEQQLAA